MTDRQTTAAARPLGLWSAIALVAGNMIGSGVFLLPASLAPYGTLSLYGWAITLGGALLLALTFSRLAARGAQAGGPYAYAREAFGDTTGFVIAWSYWISIWCANAAIAVAFAGSLGSLFPTLVSTPFRGAACALAALWLCAAINLAGVREAGRLQIVATVLKLVPLLVFGGIAIWWLDARLLADDASAIAAAKAADAPATWLGALHMTVALTLWAFLGLEAATVPAGAIHHAERTIPRATLIGTLLAGIATILACTAVLGLVPPEVAAASTAPMADAAKSLWGPAAGVAIAVVAAISCFGALNGWVLLSAQLPMAAAHDDLFPKIFARVDSQGTPRVGVLASTTLASLLVVANYTESLAKVFTFAILLSTAATLLPYVFSSAAWLKLGRSGRVVAVLALLYSLYALIGTGHEALLWGAALVGAGLPLHLALKYARR
ncbi:amino acid permease [Lysobacter brunescens]|uniref:Arginine/agmatine antiporter n=1 Tax=Lysobacter brunescens TaxID=262323 RepID=A0ABW2YF67_9GAMM